MDRAAILTELNNAAKKEFALAEVKKSDEREVEKHTYTGRTLMKIVSKALTLNDEERKLLEEGKT